MRHFAGFCRLSPALPLLTAMVVACGGGGGGGSEPPSETFYVRQSGNDSNSGATPDLAFRSIARAARDAVGGQTIIVGPGTYTVPREFTTGTVDIEDIDGEPFLMIADSSGSMTNDRAGVVLVDSRNGLFGFQISRSRNVTIQGFRFERARNDGNSAAIHVRSDSNNVTIRDCEFTRNRDGVRVEGSANVTIFNSVFYDNNRAIRLNGTSDVRIFHNTMVENGARGISIAGSDRSEVRNNILQDNSNRNIEVVDSASVASYRGGVNLIFSTRSNVDPEDTVDPSTLFTDADVGADAQFVDPNREDFHLQSTSPAIDAGGNLDGLLLRSLFELSTTADGEPDRAPIDLGYHFPAALEN